MNETNRMSMSERRSHWLTLRDWGASELNGLLELAHQLKQDPLGHRPLEGKTLAMIFHKASTRTRISFEVGTFQLGGHALMISAGTSQLSRGEPIKDSARVLSRYVDGVMIRTFAHADVEEWAQSSSTPVINGLTDLYHPCQVLADLLTIREELGFGVSRDWSELKVVWVGDGNNMAHSWIEAACALGFELRLACPEGFDPDSEVLAYAQSHEANVHVSRDPHKASQDTHVVTTDVWASMGQEEEAQARLRSFEGFQVDEVMMNRADPEAIFLHCLPAHRDEEVSAQVLEGPQSRVWDEAENRLHAQKAILAHLIGGVKISDT